MQITNGIRMYLLLYQYIPFERVFVSLAVVQNAIVPNSMYFNWMMHSDEVPRFYCSSASIVYVCTSTYLLKVAFKILCKNIV